MVISGYFFGYSEILKTRKPLILLGFLEQIAGIEPKVRWFIPQWFITLRESTSGYPWLLRYLKFGQRTKYFAFIFNVSSVSVVVGFSC